MQCSPQLGSYTLLVHSVVIQYWISVPYFLFVDFYSLDKLSTKSCWGSEGRGYPCHEPRSSPWTRGPPRVHKCHSIRLIEKHWTHQDITQDLCNGVILSVLLEVLSSDPVKVNRTPKMRIHSMENVSICLRFVEGRGVKLVNVAAEGMGTLLLLFLVYLQFICKNVYSRLL